MDYQLGGKKVLVTAGAHGIGAAAADLLTAEGATVFVVDVDAEALNAKPDRWSGSAVADLATRGGMTSAVDAAIGHFGGAPDVLICNVGVADQKAFADLTDAHWQRSHEINLMSCVRACRMVVPAMGKEDQSSVVIVSSDLAKQPEPMPMEYGVAKAGLLYLAKGLAREYAPGVRVNAVCPGPTWTRLWYRPGGIVDQLAIQYGLDRDAALARYLEDRHMPLGMTDPADVAQAIAFLASPVARMITGTTIDIGGTLRGLL